MTKTLLTTALALTTLLSSTAMAWQEDVQWPSTRIAEIAQSFLAAFNTGTYEEIVAFEEAYRGEDKLRERSAAERAKQLGAAREQIGPMATVRIESQTETRIVVVTQPELAPMLLRCEFNATGPGPDAMLDGIRISPAGQSIGTGDQAWHTRSYDTLDALLTAARDASGVPAIAVAIMEDGRITESVAVGVRSTVSRTPAGVTDPFHIGSLTKSMTATAVGRLIDEGKLRWESTLKELLPDVAMRAEYENVTIEQLLQHRAGLSAMTSLTDEDSERFDSLQGTPTEIRAAFAALLLQESPAFEANAASNYSNAGFSLAGYLAERASGMSWEALLQRDVFERAQLEHAGFAWPATPEDPDQPRGHQLVDGKYEVIPFGDYVLEPWLDPAGDTHCSVVDLARYGDAHLQGLRGRDTLVSAGTMKRLHTPLHPTLDGRPYACGWLIHDDPNLGEIHWHNGSAGTFYAHLEIQLETGRVIAVVTNIGFAGQALTEQITDLLRIQDR